MMRNSYLQKKIFSFVNIILLSIRGHLISWNSKKILIAQFRYYGDPKLHLESYLDHWIYYAHSFIQLQKSTYIHQEESISA